ncbi:MAG: septum formation protein Maf [Bauldia sp.]|nr:septum formation protein Maf [Bauldia sp.]
MSREKAKRLDHEDREDRGKTKTAISFNDVVRRRSSAIGPSTCISGEESRGLGSSGVGAQLCPAGKYVDRNPAIGDEGATRAAGEAFSPCLYPVAEESCAHNERGIALSDTSRRELADSGPSRRIVLASGSSARHKLLADAGIEVELRQHAVDERALEAELAPRQLVPRATAAALAEAKARSVADGLPDAIVIGADQVLDFEGEVWSKPRSVEEARDQLARLSGRSHRLHSAFAVIADGRVRARAVRSARLAVRPLTALDIDLYLDAAGAAVTTTVGAYQLEGHGVRLFERIEGDYFTILGLPLLPLLAALRRLEAIPW